MSNSLRLPLERKWFTMTLSRIKPEDYRELTAYWYARLCLYDGKKKSKKFWEFAALNSMDFDTSKISFQVFDSNVLTLGYPKSTDSNRIVTRKHNGIEIRTGNPKWGAVPGKLYFVIKHGEVQS